MKGDVSTVFDCGDYKFSIRFIKDGVAIRLEDRASVVIMTAILDLYQVEDLITELVAMREKLRG